MSFINYMAREINCKIVYYGPGLCGKTTNLQFIYERTNPEAKGKMVVHPSLHIEAIGIFPVSLVTIGGAIEH